MQECIGRTLAREPETHTECDSMMDRRTAWGRVLSKNVWLSKSVSEKTLAREVGKSVMEECAAEQVGMSKGGESMRKIEKNVLVEHRQEKNNRKGA